MFGNLAEMAKLMGKAKEIQANLKKFKEELPAAEFSASSADGAIKVTVSGDFRIKSVELKSADGKDAATQGRALADTINAALAAARESAQQKMNELTGGLGINLPGLF